MYSFLKFWEFPSLFVYMSWFFVLKFRKVVRRVGFISKVCGRLEFAISAAT
jgi:hypothetical protein